MISVLIVEDDPMVALINRKYLEQIGDVEIIGTVITEEDIIKALKSKKVDLILLDVFLPEKNGIEILRDLRTLGFYQDVIMITAANSSKELQKAFACGIVDYLIKPFDFKRLEIAVNKFKYKKNLIIKNDKVTQRELDNFLSMNFETEEIILPKGLNKRTMEKVIQYLTIHKEEYLTIREIAKDLKISNVTIKKYMDYFESTNKVLVKIEYGNIGRPELKYYFKNQ